MMAWVPSAVSLSLEESSAIRGCRDLLMLVLSWGRVFVRKSAGLGEVECDRRYLVPSCPGLRGISLDHRGRWLAESPCTRFGLGQESYKTGS
ncbi:hypothetical protein AXF42_Ash014585 [Apostasia shenzhenica]|uniref:Uncharacterized protein n=1 Tax=Apostasia shenzhenica TaxID=1088818 RepID=A0A2I0AK26_9ASPA|nr:hypothetical protein AXF42_Ash014585 [Apostasia shenzhenica]